MENKDKRKPVLHLPSLAAKRCRVDDEGVDCVNSPLTTSELNFNRSGLPARLMFYDRGEWRDFSRDSAAALRLTFQARKSFTELSLHGKKYLVNFLQMMQLNLLTGYLRSIAWIDVHGKCFFPSKCLEGYDVHLLQPTNTTKPNFINLDSYQDGMITMSSHPQRSSAAATPDIACQEGLVNINLFEESLISINSHVPKSSATTTPSSATTTPEVSCHDGSINIEPRHKGISSHPSNSSRTTASLEATSDVTSDLRDGGGQALGHIGSPAVHQSQDFALLHEKISRLDEADPEFTDIQNKFFAGLGMLATYATVKGISKDCHRSTSGHVRQRAFKQQEDITRRTRGDANVRYAWYATSKQGVSSIVLHGFGQPKTPKYGALYGVGVYLAPEEYSHVSAVYSDVDENGEQHVVLCRAIMGNMEQVCRGSEQFHPSSEDYDGAVDDLCNPKRYIVWSTHMNTHILPEYIVSFKLAPPWQGIIATLRGKQMFGGKTTTESGSQMDGRHKQSVKVKDAVYLPCISETGTNQGCSHAPPRSPWMSFPMLFLVMKSKLPPASMDALQQHYLNFKGGRMSRCAFIKIVRSIAGDHLVANSIKSMQTQVLGAVLVQNLLASGMNRIVDDRVAA